jgi:hypothetical protein
MIRKLKLFFHRVDPEKVADWLCNLGNYHNWRDR